MLQLTVIRQQPDFVKERLAVRNIDAGASVDAILQTDADRRKDQQQLEAAQASLNVYSKEIGQLMAKGEKEKAEEKKQAVAELKTQIPDLQARLSSLDSRLHDQVIALPTLPAPVVPRGKTPEENEVVREGGDKPVLPAGSVPHWDLAKTYRLIDFELGNKITGSGFPVYVNKGARLQRAMVQYFLDFNIAAGFTEFQPPLLVNEASAYGTTQLPDKEGQMYFADADQLYLIPTSEVPLTNLYRDMILQEKDLPVKMTAYTPCFRREAGSYGKDVRGLNRLHQFDKVEIVQIVQPEISYNVLDQMVEHVEKLLISLGLTYRILRLCGGDMGFSSALTYDFEVFSAAQERWLEVSSVSNFETFQANRLKLRYKDVNGKMQLLHTLNGSSLALPRIMACLLENNQHPGYITLPESLHRYFGADRIDA